MYDPALGRWHVVDPLAEDYYNQSPYHFAGNDPIRLIDENGMNYSPYYDSEGNFLGVDEKGFTGEIYITDQETFDKHKNAEGAVQSTEIQGDKSTKSLRVTPTLSLEAQSNIYTHVLNEMSGGDFTGLYNGEVSINTRGTLNGERITYNTADNYNRFGYKTAKNGQHRVTAFTNEYKSTLYSVESIQNYLGVHEYNGHGVLGFSGGKKLGGTHWRAYLLQAKHPTYKLLPESQQNEISERFWEYLEVENPARHNYIMKKHQSK